MSLCFWQNAVWETHLLGLPVLVKQILQKVTVLEIIGTLW